jgi:hypothetical protein
VNPLALALAAAVLTVGLDGCSALESQTESQPSRSYREILDRWTDGEREYHQLDTRLYVWATYKSGPFREAYVAEYARIFRLPEPEREAMLARETAALEQFHDFVLSAYTPVRQSGDFLTKTGIWRLYLEGPAGTSVPAARVERLSQPLPVLSTFFPYVDRWSRVFLVRFPKRAADGDEVLPSPDTDPFRLVVASTEARAVLAWGR